MSLLPSLAFSSNLIGGDGLIILLVLLFMAAPVVGIVLLVTYLSRRKSGHVLPPPMPVASAPAERMQQLELLKQQNLVSEGEYEEQRRRILAGL